MFLPPEWMDQGRTRYGDVPASGVDGSRKDEVVTGCRQLFEFSSVLRQS